MVSLAYKSLNVAINKETYDKKNDFVTLVHEMIIHQSLKWKRVLQMTDFLRTAGVKKWRACPAERRESDPGTSESNKRYQYSPSFLHTILAWKWCYWQSNTRVHIHLCFRDCSLLTERYHRISLGSDREKMKILTYPSLSVAIRADPKCIPKIIPYILIYLCDLHG